MTKPAQMAKTIRTYKDLLEEKKRLEMQLRWQKQEVLDDINELKEQLAPVQAALSAAGKFFTRDNSNWVLNAGANSVIDWVVKRGILARAGWLTKLIIPFMIKNYSSHFISENKNAFFGKLFSWIGKKNANGHAHEEHDYN